MIEVEADEGALDPGLDSLVDGGTMNPNWEKKADFEGRE